MSGADLNALREKMVREQVQARGVSDPRVLEAMRRLPREIFVDAGDREKAYEDRPLPIGHGQTISQAYIAAKMAELARLGPRDRVLEIGAGCGYLTALLAMVAGEVLGVEIVPALATAAQQRLDRLGLKGARVECFDGSSGWREHAPYDAIVVSAGAPRVPVLLLDQLAERGRLVIPVGARDNQRIVVVTRAGEEFDTAYDIPVRFVDLTGRYGWGGKGAPQA
jgi:protein-L-isoaspartate(D-aspartate) O-methyltransferase